MFITVFKIDMTQLSYALECVFNHYKMHQWIAGVQHKSRSSASTLYKIITNENTMTAFLYVQSKDVFEAGDAEKDGFVFVKQINVYEMLETVQEGNRIYVHILSVPFRRNKNKAIYLNDEKEIAKWVFEKLRKNGMVPASGECRLSKEKDIEFEKGGRVHLSSYSVSGIVTVENKELFKKGVENGFCRNKCWGAGMILFKFA